MDEDMGFILVRSDYVGDAKKICKALNKFEWDLDRKKFEVVGGEIKFHDGLLRDPTVYVGQWDDDGSCEDYPLKFIAKKIAGKMENGSIEVIICSSDFGSQMRHQSLKIFADGRAERRDEFRHVRYGNNSDFESV